MWKNLYLFVSLLCLLLFFNIISTLFQTFFFQHCMSLRIPASKVFLFKFAKKARVHFSTSPFVVKHCPPSDVFSTEGDKSGECCRWIELTFLFCAMRNMITTHGVQSNTLLTGISISTVKFLQCYRTSLHYIPHYSSSLYVFSEIGKLTFGTSLVQ